MRSLSLLLTGTVVWLATLVSPSLATDFSKFGPFAVGLQRFEIPDVTGNYPLATMVWYPAAGARRIPPQRPSTRKRTRLRQRPVPTRSLC